MRYDDAILPRTAEVRMEIADPRDQFRPGFAPRRREGQQRCRPAIEIGSWIVVPGSSLPRAEIEFPQPVIDGQRHRQG